jgi:hypothetical protein
MGTPHWAGHEERTTMDSYRRHHSFSLPTQVRSKSIIHNDKGNGHDFASVAVVNQCNAQTLVIYQ